MSARSGLGSVFGAFLLKLWLAVSSVLLNLCMQRFFLCCSVQQRVAVVFPSVSMRLRPKRTCSGVECFGGFHIKRFLHTFPIRP
nr:hypothetical protein DM860_008336 [Ipomoea trifida]GMD13606.1 EREBP-like factor [Ipomoea batatas]GMD15301.1 EREBP-like factor [Ipomoea batatas]GMD16776.1 EREBP-like factor [Ipomoea batatas]GMD21125.1 EREBP-like factor [Ipomoea batatas]